MTTARGVLTLLRPPNVFTAVSNSLAGMLIVGRVEPALLGASAALYLAGLVLNDLFDREVDARERPGRPIPSRQVSVRAAARLGAALLAGGVALGALVGPASFAVAGGVAATVLAYDGGVKRTALGPFAMGLCRAGNFLLGLSVMGWAGVGKLGADGAHGPVLLGLYVVTLTFLARDEVPGNAAKRARAGVMTLALVGVGAAAWLATRAAAWPAWLAFALLAALVARNFGPLLHDASAPRTGRAIGGGILLIPMLDASVVAAAGHPLAALGVAALALPAVVLRRWFSPT